MLHKFKSCYPGDPTWIKVTLAFSCCKANASCYGALIVEQLPQKLRGNTQ
jgi:hypothetical protein